MIRPTEIIEVFYSARAGMDDAAWSATQWLARQGVSTSALVEPHPILCARISIAGEHFDIVTADEEGQQAFLILADDQRGATDIVAWLPKKERLLRWLGAASILGEPELYAPRVATEGAVRAFRSPLSWLRANRQGVVVLDPVAAALRLHGLGPLIAEDADHGLELRSTLSLPPLRIFVPNFEQAAA